MFSGQQGCHVAPVFEAIWGERAIDISDERFASAWSDLLLRGLRP